jgi:hypothetical protein
MRKTKPDTVIINIRINKIRDTNIIVVINVGCIGKISIFFDPYTILDVLPVSDRALGVLLYRVLRVPSSV